MKKGGKKELTKKKNNKKKVTKNNKVKSGNKNLWITLVVVGLLIINLVIILFFIKDMNSLKVTLVGEDSITIDVGSAYHDLGFEVKKYGKNIPLSEVTYIENNDVDSSTIGKYEVTYKVTYDDKVYEITRDVLVVDKESPVITANIGEVTKDYCTKEYNEELEYSAIDNYDGDLTNNVLLNEEDGKLILSVLDSSGNLGVLELALKIASKPGLVFSLKGSATEYVAINSTYKDSGYNYSDGCGLDLPDEITVSGIVDTSTLGEYKITYTNMITKESLTRTVIVYNPSVGENIPTTGEKIIYFTFDDGPSLYTEKLLGILDKYNVKATFFVTNQFTNYIPLLKEIDSRGHTIGVHSLTHKWSVYKSVDTYINDFDKMNAIIEKYTGYTVDIFRFPGGSSNAVSRKYAKGVVSAIASVMTSKGYVYFDWDVDSRDAENKSSSEIYNNVVNGVKHCTKCVVLMHDIKKNTVNVMDDILATLTKQGYKFGTLSVNSPTCHHSIKN